MFDFQKLIVYQKAKAFNLNVWDFLENTPNLTRTNRDQLDRAAFSIALNIAEGTGRFTKRDRRNFYVVARSSALECAAIFDLLCDKGIIDGAYRDERFAEIDELSRILLNADANIEDSRMSVLGGEFALILLILHRIMNFC